MTPSGVDQPVAARAETTLPGIDLDRLTSWLDEELPGYRSGPVQASLLTGGRSNLTYRLDDGTRSWVLRRPPLGAVLATAHDMSREHRVLVGLQESAVPVPTPLALCTDSDVLGCSFYLMDFVPGTVLSEPDQAGEAARRVSELLVDTLIALHQIDPAAVGLAKLGRPQGFLSRQVDLWDRQFTASWPDQDATHREVVRRLRAQLPEDGPGRIVHGDYRLTNLMYSSDLQRVAAVVDWEMATLGDPLTDVALLFAYHSIAPQTPEVMPDFGPQRGYLDPGQLLERYAAGTTCATLDPAALYWHLGLAFFKIAAIGAGLHARRRRSLSIGASFNRLEPTIRLALDMALTHVSGGPAGAGPRIGDL